MTNNYSQRLMEESVLGSLDFDKNIISMIFYTILFALGVGAVLYMFLWIIIPQEKNPDPIWKRKSSHLQNIYQRR